MLKVIALFDHLNEEKNSPEKLAAFGLVRAFLFWSQCYKSLVFNVFNVPWLPLKINSFYFARRGTLVVLLTDRSVARSSCMLLNEDVAHGFDELVSIIWCMPRYVPTRVGIIRIPCCTKPDSGVTGVASVSVVHNETNSCLRMWRAAAYSIETFFVAVALQWGLGPNQRFPHVTAQWGGAVMPVRNQGVQRVGVHVDDSEIDLVADLHTETGLGEWRVPVGWQLGLMWIKPGLPSWEIKLVPVAPVFGIEMKRVLEITTTKKNPFIYITGMQSLGYSRRQSEQAL